MAKKYNPPTSLSLLSILVDSVKSKCNLFSNMSTMSSAFNQRH